MKLQQKLESSLDDIIKTSKKKPTVSKKSKGITRAGLNKLKRLKNQRPKPQKPQNKPQKTSEKPQKNPENRQKDNKAPQDRQQNPRKGQRDFPARQKWSAPRGRGRHNRNFRGRNRN